MLGSQQQACIRSTASMALPQPQKKTRILRVDASKIGRILFDDPKQSFLGDWKIQLSETSPDAANLQEAASRLRDSDVPVAFPTETVYGLGADATRSSAVRGIYNAKQRPSDNPLIVHVSSLSQLRNLLSGCGHSASFPPPPDPIPQIYHPLISRFWPGPLTILLPLPTPSPLASEVTASLPTVAVRMPSSTLALALIQLAGIPLAAPSANASSKPSPTTATHVFHDLSGRIDLILDGGPCEVGVESTVVDGLTNPPMILRPGGISIGMLKECSGWEDVKVAYKDGAETGVPRAPGMKYKHYSPNASVLLFNGKLNADSAKKYLKSGKSLGVLTTKSWGRDLLQVEAQGYKSHGVSETNGHALHGDGKLFRVKESERVSRTFVDTTQSSMPISIPSAQYSEMYLDHDNEQDMIEVWTISLGADTADIARGLFSALRELDQKGVDVIFVEGIDDSEGCSRAAIMNRLRKAAESEIIL